jgi:hypothetical protein
MKRSEMNNYRHYATCRVINTPYKATLEQVRLSDAVKLSTSTMEASEKLVSGIRDLISCGDLTCESTFG